VLCQWLGFDLSKPILLEYSGYRCELTVSQARKYLRSGRPAVDFPALYPGVLPDAEDLWR
jgi:hypothetical protein